MEEKIVKLTGLPVSEEMQDILKRLSEKQYVTLEEINATKEMQTARSNVDYSRPTIQLENRDELRAFIVDKLSKFGSVTIDENGKEIYNGEVEKNSRLDIVIGLPASGKSSAIVNSISSEFHSKVIDNDEAKKEIPQFNDGWGAGVVHEESQLISEAVFRQAVINHENIVLPKVGSDPEKLIKDAIGFAKSEGYTVNVHYVELDRNKALGRMLNRFIEDGRFLDPALIDKYDNEHQGNRIEQCYETLKNNADLIDGYSKWDNDVLRGEKPILLETQNLMGEFVTDARRLATGENYETMKGESDYERNDERNSKGSTIDSRDNGESGGIRTQSSTSDFQRGRKEYDNAGTSERNGQVLQVDTDKIGQMYRYELDNNISNPDRVTEWFGDYSMPIIKTGTTLEKFNQMFASVFEESQNGLEWNVVHDMDDENGNPTEWATQLSENNFVWIDHTEKGYEVTLSPDPNAGYVATLETLDSAKKYVEQEIALGKSEAQVSQFETQSITPMQGVLATFDSAYMAANGSMSIQDVNDCIRTNNLERLERSIENDSNIPVDVRESLKSSAIGAANAIEKLSHDGYLTLDEQRDNILTSLNTFDEYKFDESMDDRLMYLLETYGVKDVADDIIVETNQGSTTLSAIQLDMDNPDGGFKTISSNRLPEFSFSGYDIVEVANISQSDGLLLRFATEKEGYDLAVWNDENGTKQFAFADAGCLDSHQQEYSSGDILAMGEVGSTYSLMNMYQTATHIAEECLGDSFDNGDYHIMYVTNDIDKISMPDNDPIKLPVQAEFHRADSVQTVYFMDDSIAEQFAEKRLDHSNFNDVSVDIGVRNMSDAEMQKMIDSAKDVYAYGTDDHGYISFEVNKEAQTVSVVKYDTELTPVTQEKVSFSNKQDFAVEVADFSALRFVDRHLQNTEFSDVHSLSWVNTKQFMTDVSEHEASVRAAVQKFDSLEEIGNKKYDIIFKDKDGDVVTFDSIDTIDDFSEYVAPASGTFEVLEAGKMVVKGDIDDNMHGIIEEAITEDTDSISLDKEREALELDHPVSEQELAHAVSEILYAHSDKDISLDEIEADIVSQIETAQGNPDQLDSIISRLNKIYESDHPTLEERVKIYSCEERLNSLKDETQAREQDREIELREREIPTKNEPSFQSVGDILKAGLPQAEADIEINKLLKEQGRPDEFIHSVQLMSHCEPDIAIQMADASAIVSQEEVQQKGCPQQGDIGVRQPHPLNKVEEMIEGNYNHIDGIINNTLPDKENKQGLRDSVEHLKDVANERNQSQQEDKEKSGKSSRKHEEEL